MLGANQDKLAYNIYAYCSNDPVNNVDPSGRWLLKFFENSFRINIKMTMSLFFPTYTPPSNKFDKGAAVDYAKKNWNNPKGANGSNCTYFTSNAMRAGGLTMNSYWWSGYGTESEAYRKAENQRRFLSEVMQIKPVVVTKEDMKLDQISPGDFIYFFHINDPSKSNHAAIVVEVTSDDIIYAAWSTPKDDGSLNKIFSEGNHSRIEIYDLNK